MEYPISTPVTLNLSLGQVQVVLAGLAELPLKASQDAFNAVSGQTQSQLTKADSAPPQKTVPASAKAK